MRCVLCGKEYKREVTDAHLKSHGMGRKEYDSKASRLAESVWEFYWTHENLRVHFPDPLSDEAEDGKQTFRQWCELPKVRNRHPELQGESK